MSNIRLALHYLKSEYTPTAVVLPTVSGTYFLWLWLYNQRAVNMTDALEGIAVIGVGLFLVFLWHLFHTVPVKQRDEALRDLAERDARLAALDHATKPRKLSGEQKARLAEVVRDWSDPQLNVNIIHAKTSAEAQDFAADLEDAFRMAGAKTTLHDGGMYPHDPRARGLEIHLGGKDTERAVQLQDRLSTLGIASTRLGSEVGGPSSIMLYVARLS